MSEIVAEGIIRASDLRDYLGVFTPIVSEGRIHFNDEGLTGRVVDPANVAMINPAVLSTEAFEHYDAPGAVTIGTNLVRLEERIKPADADTMVHLAVDMETRKLHVEYGRASHTVALIDPDSIRKEPDKPDHDLPNWATIEGEDFAEAVTQTQMVSDHVYLRGDPDAREIQFVGQGDTDDVDYTLGEEDVIEAVVNETTESVFSLDYMEELAKPIPDHTEVTLRFDDEWPVWIEWDGADGRLSVEGMLAPRIQRN